MKKIIYFMMAAAMLLGCNDPAEKEQFGSVYGIITDKTTGEPIKTASVELQPGGAKYSTGSDGHFEIPNLKTGDYTLNVTKTGYIELLNYKVKVGNGKPTNVDVLIEKLPPSLRVVNDNKPPQDISELDFGSAEADVARSFSIFNDGPEKLEWEITKTSEWISTISKINGSLNAGATQAVIVTIDRSKLISGENTTTIHVTSDNGSKQLTVKASNNRKAPVLNTLNTTNIAATTATFNGEIMDAGVPAYTERGFVYATATMPTLKATISKRTVEVTATAKYSTDVGGLELGNTYFVRAYAINKVDTAYSTNEVSFKTEAIFPQVTTQDATSITGTSVILNGTVVSIGDPEYTVRGFVYGTQRNPEIGIAGSTNRTVPGTGTGAYNASITSGLTTGATYYVRAYATNSKGPAYGVEKSFTPNYPNIAVLQTAKLMVQKEDVSYWDIDWTSANNLCQNSTVGGYTGWRLPTLNELLTIYNNVDIIGFDDFCFYYNCYYWTSSFHSYDTRYSSTSDKYYNYYVVNFYDGKTSYTNRGSTCYCRCVRTLP